MDMGLILIVCRDLLSKIHTFYERCVILQFNDSYIGLDAKTTVKVVTDSLRPSELAFR